MGMGISGGFAAGAGADQLEQILKRAFLEQSERRRAAQEDARIEQDNRRLNMADADRKTAMADLGKSRDVQNAARISGMLRKGQALAPGTVGALTAGDLGDLVQHDAADLPSTAISGLAQAGPNAPMMGQLRMMAAGRPARDTFAGTAEQASDEQTREDRTRQFAQTAQDRKDAAAAAAQARTDAASTAQGGREDLVRLAASLRPPPQSGGGGGLSPTAEANLTTKLATDWQKVSAPAREMDRQFNLMQTGLRRFHEGDKNGGSQAVLVTFQKILDPTSVVRESEYARSAEGVSLLQRMQGYTERLKSGGAGVPDAALQEMVKTAEQFTANSRRTAEGQRTRLKAFADHYKIPHELVFDDAAPGGATTPAASKPTAADLIKKYGGG